MMTDKARAIQLSNLGGEEVLHGNVEKGLAMFEEALSLFPDSLLVWGNKIYALDLLDPPIGWERHQKVRKEFGALFPEFRPYEPKPTDPNKRLTIGYVSADFNYHSACDSFASVLFNHTPNKYRIILYSSTIKLDARTEELAKCAEFKQIRHLSQIELADLIRADGVDILVDLSGISAGSRLVTFGRKPAPIQITAWGYGGGTGVKAIDYQFVDPFFISEDKRYLCTEECWDLPCHIPYTPPRDCTPVVAPPSILNGYITFGNLGRYGKITDAQLHRWADIMNKLPKSRLVLKAAQWERPEGRKRVWEIMEEHNISSYRIELKGITTQTQHRLYYSGIDIALDTFPHSGGVTNFEATHMGCPVVTQVGDQPGARIGGTVLSSLGLDELITYSFKEYHDTAVSLANDAERLMALRRASRERLLNSTAGNPLLYAQEVEKAYDEMWRRECQK